MLQWTWGCIYLLKLMFSLSSDKYSEVELLDHMVILFLIFLRNFHTVFHSGCINLHSYQQCTRVPFSPCSPTLIIFLLFDDSHSNRCKGVSYCSLICISLYINDVEHLFMYLLALCMSSWGKYLLRSSAQFLNFIFC